MKTLAVHQSSELYGSDRSFLSVISAIFEPDAENHEVDVLLPEPGPLAIELDNLGARVSYESRGYLRRAAIRRPFKFIFESLLTTWVIFRKFKSYDIIYINTVVCFSAILAVTFTNKRKFVHVRELPTGFEMIAFRLLLRLSRAKLIFNSDATKRAFGLPGLVVYNGVAAPDAHTNEWTTHDCAERHIRILLLGRINNWKGQDLLIKALALTDRSLEVCIVGSPISDQEHLLTELKQQATGIGHGKNIQFVEFTDKPEQYLDWADFVVVPSLKPEPFGRVAIEGFAHGKPVIGAKHGGLVEIITNQHNGYLFQPGSASALAEVLKQLPQPLSAEYGNLVANALSAYKERFSLTSYQKVMRATLLK